MVDYRIQAKLLADKVKRNIKLYYLSSKYYRNIIMVLNLTSLVLTALIGTVNVITGNDSDNSVYKGITNGLLFVASITNGLTLYFKPIAETHLILYQSFLRINKKLTIDILNGLTKEEIIKILGEIEDAELRNGVSIPNFIEKKVNTKISKISNVNSEEIFNSLMIVPYASSDSGDRNTTPSTPVNHQNSMTPEVSVDSIIPLSVRARNALQPIEIELNTECPVDVPKAINPLNGRKGI
jgi:hypothetical protein